MGLVDYLRHGNRRIHSAVIAGDIELAKSLSDELNWYGMTAKHIAQYLRVEKFSNSDFSTNPHLFFNNSKWLFKVARHYKSTPIPSDYLWNGKLYQRELEEGFCLPMNIEWIGETIGKAAFTCTPLAKGQFIGEYTGEVKPYSSKSFNNYCFELPLCNSSYMVDAIDYGNLTRFINHSDSGCLEPLAAFHAGILHIILIAKRDIDTGEQLSYDYGPDYWSLRKDPVKI